MHRSVRMILLLAGIGFLPAMPAVSGQGASGAGAGPESDGALPKDVDRDSRSRLPLIGREEVNEQVRRAYDAAAASSPSGRPEGVAAIRLHRSGVDVRWDSALGRRLTELAIITTAREHDQPYEWSLHEMEALSVGLEPRIIDAVRHRRSLAGLGTKVGAIIQFGRELFGTHYVTAETYARAKHVFGQRDLSDFVVGLMAPHAREATFLTAFDQHLPAGVKPQLPVP